MHKGFARGGPSYFSVFWGARKKAPFTLNKKKMSTVYLTQTRKHLLLNLSLVLFLYALTLLLLRFFLPDYIVSMTSNAVYQSKSLVSFDYKTITIATFAFLIIIALVSLFAQYRSKSKLDVPERIRFNIPKTNLKKSKQKKKRR